MICEKCNSERIHWRCDNHEKGLTKYKCLDCGHIIIRKTEKPKPLFNDTEMNQLKEEKERVQQERLQKLRSKGGRKRWLMVSGRNYAKTIWGTWAVQKRIDGKNYYGGTYKTEEIASKVVERLNECGWDLSQLDEIKKEVHREVNL